MKIKEKWRTNETKPEAFSSTLYLVTVTRFCTTPIYKDRFFLHQKYIAEELSASQIAKEIFSSKTSVLKALKEAGIPIRKPHLPYKNPSQPKFGQKKRQDKLEPHKAEENIIETIKMLHEQGLTLRQIANVLSKMKVKTKKQGRRWHPEMVRRALF